jgi:asparagine synthase (glutamine-hydrolysing)
MGAAGRAREKQQVGADGMCGIAGIFAYGDGAPPVDQGELLKIRDAMERRGPDGAGLWISPDGRVGLAHRRLAIIDLSDNGAQPMATPDGRYHITFNGEIYNYRELRGELEARGFQFRSTSDTEVLLHLYADRGPDMVRALRGMFAFALWDDRERRLFLARDAFGIKPLYYADDGAAIRVASQVKALLAGGGVSRTPDAAGQVGFLLWGHVPDPFTSFRAIRSLPAGSTLSIATGGRHDDRTFFDLTESLRAWSLEKPPAPGEIAERMRQALLDSVRHHMVADVPVGVFLSSGLDSTTLAGLAREVGAGPLHTVTLGFKEFVGTHSDEVPMAERVARHYGTEHQTHWVSKEDFFAEQARLLEAMDQPSVDGINSYFVCKATAASGLKVALSGIGGDELLGGYSSFWQVPLSRHLLGPLGPVPALGRAFRRVSAPLLSNITSSKYASLFEYGPTFAGAYMLRRSVFLPWEIEGILDPHTFARGCEELKTLPRLSRSVEKLDSDHLKVVALESEWYMRNQLLRDADWAGMAHSLEVRVPLVDVDLYRAIVPTLAGRVRPDKHVMAAAVLPPLPEEVLARRKSGFSIPVQSWLRQEAISNERRLKGWARIVHGLNAPLRVAMIFRERRKGAYSIEGIFDGIARELSKRADVVRYELGSRWRVLWDAYRLRRLRADVYHVTGDVHYMIALLPRDKTLLTVHDIYHYLAQLRGLRRWLYKWIWLIVPMRLARKVTTISDETSRTIRTHLPIRDRDLTVVPDCVSPSFRADPRPFDAREPVVLQVGTRPNKNVANVVKALRGLPCRLSVIGAMDVATRAELEAAGVSYETGEHLSEDEMVRRYRSADIVCFASLYEGFGMPVLEAQATGRPLITSDIEPMKSIAGGGACLVDPRSPESIRGAVRRILDDDAFRSGLVDRGFVNVSRYSQEHVTRQYYEIYRDMHADAIGVERNPSIS